MAGTPRARTAPFLKWAGGKASLAEMVVAACPPSAGTYHEPFLGGAAVFFALRESQPDMSASLNDANADLVSCYQVVRDSPSSLLSSLEAIEHEYLARDEEGRAEYFYACRGAEPTEAIARAARLVFLNKTAYNGLYRVNAAGKFNVPHGRYKRPRIADRERICAASRALSGVKLTSEDFATVLARAISGDFVYLDPPYQPLSATSHFTAYTADNFGIADQARLAGVVHELTARGVRVMLSNSDHAEVMKLYDGRGYGITKVSMARSINSRADKRDAVSELLIDNQPSLPSS